MGLDLGKHPDRFGLEVGDFVRTTQQYDNSGLEHKPTKYGYVVYFQGSHGAWLQWNDGTREILGCAWLEKYDGPMDGEMTEVTIADILGGEA